MTQVRSEALKIFFVSGASSVTEEYMLGENKLTLRPWRPGALSKLDTLEIILQALSSLEMAAIFLENGRTIPAHKILARTKKKQSWPPLETETLKFQFGVVHGCGIYFVEICEKVGGAAIRWDKWVQSFIELEGFIQAWVFDVDYDNWQNVKDPLLYQLAKRDYSHLPMKMNNLPPPLDRMEIDTSGNPGRWILKRGYVEAVCATMWLSDLFWERVGRDHKQRLYAASWLNVTEPTPHVVRIQAAENSFHDESTADVQNRLRELLYL